MSKVFVTIVILLVLLAGVLIPKIAIKNLDLSSSPCAERAFRTAQKFPAWFIVTPKVESFTISSIDIAYYTVFGIKTGKHQMTFCTLIKE